MARKKLSTSESLIETRKALGMNQFQFWSRIGVTQSGGSRYESGRNMPVPTSILLWLLDAGRISEKDLADAAKAIAKKPGK